LLRNAEIGENSVDLKLRLGASESNIRRFTVDLAPSAQGRSDETEGINRVTLTAIVLSNEDCQIFFEADSLVFKRPEILQAKCFKKHGDSATNSAFLGVALRLSPLPIRP
jgi:hypothetical protein